MFLKYIEIQGFKSFPDKLTIELHPGITGIVGPNGSGKSNVSDAIRWVLGEQSAKTLRGGKMEDVIFSGTEERKAMGFAEVSVCFDNADHHFKTDFEEVLITRRYFRSGESEYYLNKTACRLRDIHELMMDTGMGRDGYSMVGQGKIDEIISAKPEDRRTIFEEAAGISKFRYRKQESERKMQQTGENLIRLLDIIGEIEGRLEPLEKESEKAKSYLSLRDELKENEISLSIYLLDDLKEKLKKTKELLEINSKDLENEKENIQNTERNALLLQDKSKKIQGDIDSVNEKIYSIKNEISSVENSINILNNSKAYNLENINRIRNEISELKSKKEQSEEQISTLNTEKEEISVALNELKENLLKLQQEILNLGNNSAEDLKNIELLNQSILDYMQQSAECKAKISSLNTLVETNKNRILDLDDDIQIKEEDIEIAQKRVLQEEETGKAILIKLSKIRDKKSVAEKDYAKLFLEKNKIQENRDGVNLSLQNAESRIKMLVDLEREMEGFSRSVKAVVQGVKNGTIKNVEMFGTVSDIIKVPSKYTTAIEVALGNSAQNIITKSEDDAKRAIEYLKSTKNGRATFLPISSVKGKVLDVSEIKKATGFIGVASSLVENNFEFDGIIKELLGRTLVFENIDNAISFSKKENYRYRIATLEGEIVSAGGAITGGTLGKGTGFLSRKNQIDNLKKQIEDYKTQLEQQDKMLSEFQQKCEKQTLTVKDVENEEQLCQNELFKSNYNFEHYKSVLESHLSELEEIKSEKCSLEKSFEQIKNNTAEKQQELKNCEQKIADNQANLKELQENNSKNMTETSSINSKITKHQIDISNFENDIKVIDDSVLRIEIEISELQKQIDLKDMQLHSSDTEEGSFLKKIEELEEKISDKNQELENENNNLIKLREYQVQNEDTIIENQNVLKNANEKVVFLSQEQVRIENKETRQQAEFDSITNRMWEDYELTYISALPLKKEIENISETQKLVNSLKGKIRALGNVNVSAIEEYSDLKERYEFLSNQKKDMEDAKETLAKIIDDIETMMAKQFTEQLSIINDAFKRTFSHLFNGGTAELILSDPENVLTSGVEIQAQPPGKKLQNMTLFSGGEKAIIGISLLFALLEVRPSPLCVLDEIEAALDDVNVSRFASYLRNISTHSQIAVITHRRGTMEEADRLYGVTMQEKGVSKLLQLNIDEIEQQILKNKKE